MLVGVIGYLRKKKERKPIFKNTNHNLDNPVRIIKEVRCEKYKVLIDTTLT